jgi:hypothetical protein
MLEDYHERIDNKYKPSKLEKIINE